LVREVDALDSRLTTIELHRNVTVEVEEEEVVFEDGEKGIQRKLTIQVK